MLAACQSLPVPSHSPLAVPTLGIPRLRPRPRHPLGFYVICLVVACERLAAYILSSSIVLMLCERYGYARADALRLAGLVNAAIYLGTLPGGLWADRRLGYRRAASISTVLLALGYGSLVFATPLALVLSLALLVCGSALFKPSTQALISRLYPLGDSRLEAAQIGFYMAVNAGAALGSLLAGLVVRGGGWGAAFALAAAALAIGRLLLAAFQDALNIHPLAKLAAASGDIRSTSVSRSRRVLTIVALMLAMMIYTVCFGQVEGSLLLWAQERTDRVVLGFEVPAAWFVALPAILVLVLGPAQLALLEQLHRRFSTRALVAGGLLSAALSFVVMMPVVVPDGVQRVSMGWLIACMTLMVIGELLVAPLGLALLLQLTPARLVGVVIGGWYISGALGYWLAGELGAMWVNGPRLGVLLLLAALPACGSVSLLGVGVGEGGAKNKRGAGA